jgi:hypothetical protein
MHRPHRLSMRTAAVLLAGSLATSLTLAAGVAPQASGLHLDHVPIAVRDLSSAAEQFRALGFTIKPGQRHHGGVENASIKFADRSYIELITAHDARDSLATEYQRFLRAQEGGAYVFLRDPSGSFSERVRRAGGRRTEAGPFAFVEFPAPWHAPHLQLIEYLAPAHDPAGIYQHRNGTRRLVAVWMFVDRPDDPIVRELGGRPAGVNAFAFENRPAAAATLADGTCLMLTPRGVHDPAGSLALAILVEVESFTTVKRANRGRFAKQGSTMWLPPSEAHGVWLGFVERATWLAARCVA